MEPRYIYLRPGIFSVVGFTYGKAAGSVAKGGKVKVRLVQSGRWAEHEAESIELKETEIEHRIVTAEEALDGAGTFVGSAICTSRLRSGGARVWDYGLVVGYKWDPEIQIGRLDVNFGGTTEAVEYAPDCTQDVAVEVYALQPCGGQSTSLVMAQEMMQQHEWVYNAFNGVGQTAVRDTRKILSDIGAKMVDETKTVPLLDIGSFDITRLSIRHILDYVFYKEGGRPSPAGVVFGDTIFDVVEHSSGDTTSTPRRRQFGSSTAKGILSDGLSDSEDDENSSDEDTRAREPSGAATKRRRLSVSESPGLTTTGRSGRMNTPETRRIELESEVDQLLALRRSDVIQPTSNKVVPRKPDEAGNKSDFQPSSTQTAIHLVLANGKYASMNAQRFVESVQIYWRKFGFFPHPAVLRGLFGWDFGTRGLSVLHFARVTESEKRTRVRCSDMSDFSKKNSLPMPADATDFAVLAGAVDVLYNIARHLYQPVVHQTLEAAETFLGELRVTDLPVSPSALTEIASWIDDQLELFRIYIADDNWARAATIQSHFSASHETFVRVHQAILRQDVFSAVKAAKTDSVRNVRSNRVNIQDKRVTIPVDVRKALPKQGQKEICLRFLSAQGCRGKNGICIIKHLCHFKPATLPDIVRDFIINNYGGLSADML